MQRQFDAGQAAQAWLVWGGVVVLPALAVALLDGALARVSGLLSFAWTVVVLYLCLGFRQFSHHFTAIRAALESGDELRARQVLAQWLGGVVIDWPRAELLRRTMAAGILASHRHVLGVLAWYAIGSVLGLGAAGAVLYRLADGCAQWWADPARDRAVVSAALSRLAQWLWCWIDAPAARLSALAFAVVGHFEQALERWRQQRRPWSEPSDALLLAVAGGAVQVRLVPLASEELSLELEEREPQLAHLASVVGLVWRSVVLWLLLLALALLARVL
jgi:adenosylcobinamide-phosphate synthase